MGCKQTFFCDSCDIEVHAQDDLAHVQVGGEWEGEVCEPCLNQLWVRARPVLSGESVLKSIG